MARPQYRAIEQLSDVLMSGYVANAKFRDWLIALHYTDMSPEKQAGYRKYPPDAIKIIGNWAYARSMEDIIDHMPPGQKTKEIEKTFPNMGNRFIDKEIFSYEDLVDEAMELEVVIEVTDEDANYGPDFTAVLNAQLEQAITQWQRILEHPTIGELARYSTIEEYADRRDLLEYAMIGIRLIHLNGHLQNLPYFTEYCKKLKELDLLFRKLLDGKTVPLDYADRTFWWRQTQSEK